MRRALIITGCFVILVAHAAAAFAASAFTTSVETDAGTGWKVLVLRYTDPKLAASSLEARIAPEVGGNLFSLKIGDDELLHQPPTFAELKLNRAGVPILFPSPNRVRDARFTFEGKTFEFVANNEKNFIHGLVRTRPWSFAPPSATSAAAKAVVHIDWDAQQPEFARFPIEHRLTVTYTLRRDGLEIAYQVDNKSAARLPFGFGLHPWFRVPGKREDVRISVPAPQRMEAEAKLPTGKLIPVANTPYDLKKGAAISTLNLDDVYYGMKPQTPARFELLDRGVTVTMSASDAFTHVVVFTPPDRPVFCIEPQTSSTDAHNLHAKGLTREAHLIVVDKGESARGRVNWRIARTSR